MLPDAPPKRGVSSVICSSGTPYIAARNFCTRRKMSGGGPSSEGGISPVAEVPAARPAACSGADRVVRQRLSMPEHVDGCALESARPGCYNTT